jgi:AcrR family transcriptional regulator
VATTRDRLVDAGLRVLTTSGPSGLNARRLAAEIGSSTMTVYTHFGGMPGLYEALARESFNRLGRELHDAPRSDDPVADLLTHALIYHRFVCADPHRYRLMFGASAPNAGPFPSDQSSRGDGLMTLAAVNVAFREVVHLVRGCMDAGRLRAGEPAMVTGQMWSLLHGFVMLELAGVFGGYAHGVGEVLAPASINLLVGLGDELDAARESVALAWCRSGLATESPHTTTGTIAPAAAAVHGEGAAE